MSDHLQTHPTVIRFHERGTTNIAPPMAGDVLDPAWLRQLCLDAGAADVGFVAIDRAELDSQRAELLDVLPRTQALISFVCRMNRAPIRSPSRSVANLEFHHAGDAVDEVGHRIVASLEQHGITALNPAMGFPMEMARFPGKTWVVSHKPVAVAAGLGQIGIHRNVIHPIFGNFILLGTVLVAGSDVEVHVRKRFPHKRVRQVGNGIRPQRIEDFLNNLHLVFKKNRAVGLDLTYHFTFTGAESVEATIVIRDGTLGLVTAHEHWMDRLREVEDELEGWATMKTANRTHNRGTMLQRGCSRSSRCNGHPRARTSC
ncbi:MAG: hypothetical protein H0X37_27295 [Herpetosiphonaceae bacterium]|nr:hypothetical protein [Herpetosiphonaceae bacterium]